MELIAARAEFNGGMVIVAASGNESKRQKYPKYEVSASVPAAAKGTRIGGGTRKNRPRVDEGGHRHPGNRERGGDPHACKQPDKLIPSRH